MLDLLVWHDENDDSWASVYVGYKDHR